MKKLVLLPIKRAKFTLKVVHKVQGIGLEQGVIEFDLRKQKLFVLRQIYTTLSSEETYETQETQKICNEGK